LGGKEKKKGGPLKREKIVYPTRMFLEGQIGSDRRDLP